GEVLLAVPDYKLSEDQWQLLVGGTLGDGSLRSQGKYSAYFRVAHAARHKDYLAWKHRMLLPFSRSIGPVGHGIGFSTLTMPALVPLRQALYAEGGAPTVSPNILESLDARALAVWYGDDGSFMGSYARWGRGKAVLYNKSLQPEARAVVMAAFERLGLGRPRDDGRGFWFSSQQTARLHRLIAPYVHPAVDCKLHPSERGRFAWHPVDDTEHTLALPRQLRVRPVAITKRYTKPAGRHGHRFDLEVEGHHTYLADGVVVHNSPETTTGGRALKFYASVRLDIRRQDTIKNGAEPIGVRTKVKVVKNKLAPPVREAGYDVIYGV